MRTLKPIHWALLGSAGLSTVILIAVIVLIQNQNTDIAELKQKISELETQTTTPTDYSDPYIPPPITNTRTDTSYIDSQIQQIRREQEQIRRMVPRPTPYRMPTMAPYPTRDSGFGW